MKILIGADIVPTESNKNLFELGDARELIGEELLRVFSSADYRMFNLEAPLTNKQSPILKCGKSFMASPNCVSALKEMDVNLLTLANNHILDQGENGLKETMDALCKANINYVGVGKNISEASKPFVFVINEKKIGVYACAEHEFSIADDNSYGANPYDPLECFDHISELKQTCDFVIVLYHGGKEYYRYPSPNLQKVCHKMIEKGAGLVVCQHSHCVGAEEKYEAGTIVYGQGNFIFDGSSKECWQTSLLVQVSDDFKIDYIPIIKEGARIRLAQNEDKKNILDGFMTRSKEIQNPGFVKATYERYANEYVIDLLTIASGKRYSLLTKLLNKMIGGNRLIKKLLFMRYTQKKRIVLLNRITCESYNELFTSGIVTTIKKELNESK